VYPLIEIIDLAIDQPSEEASASHPECILWATVHCNWNEPRPGIYVVRVRLLPGVWLPLASYVKVIYNEVVIGLARSRAMVRARCSVRMRVLVVSSTLSMYFLSDQPTSLLVWTWKAETITSHLPCSFIFTISSAYMIDTMLWYYIILVDFCGRFLLLSKTWIIIASWAPECGCSVQSIRWLPSLEVDTTHYNIGLVDRCLIILPMKS